MRTAVLHSGNLCSPAAQRRQVRRNSRGLSNVTKRFTSFLAMLLVVAVLPAMASTDKAAKALFEKGKVAEARQDYICLLYTSPSPRDGATSRMPSSA